VSCWLGGWRRRCGGISTEREQSERTIDAGDDSRRRHPTVLFYKRKEEKIEEKATRWRYVLAR